MKLHVAHVWVLYDVTPEEIPPAHALALSTLRELSRVGVLGTINVCGFISSKDGRSQHFDPTALTSKKITHKLCLISFA